jgi:hypothetical protein
MTAHSLTPHFLTSDTLRSPSLTPWLKQQLWQRFGTAEHPAEWDGRVYGGGKTSQRWWEYFKAIEYLDLRPGDRVLDIGGGSPATGLSFFPRLLAASRVQVAVLDVNFGEAPDVPDNVELVHGLAEKSRLIEVIGRYQPTHISCVSVLEHASSEQQLGIFAAVEESFRGENFVCTMEFHEITCFFEQQLTTATLSPLVSTLTRFYLSDIETAPLHAVNALCEFKRLWYPLALRFCKCAEENG